MPPLPTNQHLPMRSRRVKHRPGTLDRYAPFTNQPTPAHEVQETTAQSVTLWTDMPPSSCMQHLPMWSKRPKPRSRFSRNAPFTMLATPVRPCGPADRHPRDAPFTWQHLPMWSRRANPFNHTTATPEIPPLLATREHLSKRSRIPNHRAVTPEIPHSPRNTCP